MPLNEPELMDVYHGLMKAYPEDLHIARPLIQMLQAQGEQEEARELAMRMARRMLALGYSSYALAFLSIAEQLHYPDESERESMRTMAELTLATETYNFGDSGQIFKLIEELSDMESQDFLQHGNLLRLPAGRDIVMQGEASRNFYIIVHGEVSVHMDAHDGSHVNLVTLEKGDFFGEVACVHQMPRTATVTSSTAVELLELSGEDVTSLIANSPMAGVSLMKVVNRRMMESVALTHHAFREAAVEDRQWLGNESELLEFKAGEILMAANQKDTAYFYILCFGDAELQVSMGGQMHAYPFDLDEMYGDVVPMLGLPEYATLIAKSRCMVCKIPAEIFHAFSNVYGGFGRWVLRHAEQRDAMLGKAHQV